MAIPDRITIAYDPEDEAWLDHVGSLADGRLYYGFGYWHHDRPPPDWPGLLSIGRYFRESKQWSQELREVVAVHLFDPEGWHRQTIVRRAGVEVTQRNEMGWSDETIREVISGLGAYTHGNIAIREFDVTVDGIRFSLTKRSMVDGNTTHEYADLEPNGIAFTPPWDGSYDS